MTTYACTVQTETVDGAWRGSVGSPTFYLESSVQGITSTTHAERIIRSWLADAKVSVLGVSVVDVSDRLDKPAPCGMEYHFGTIARINHSDPSPDAPTGWRGIHGAMTLNSSKICDACAIDWHLNYPGRDLPTAVTFRDLGSIQYEEKL